MLTVGRPVRTPAGRGVVLASCSCPRGVLVHLNAGGVLELHDDELDRVEPIGP